tara:strand:- start:1387 stop:1503 length:117 start_codon:yes stop_codon:yes gene_type:complete
MVKSKHKSDTHLEKILGIIMIFLKNNEKETKKESIKIR